MGRIYVGGDYYNINYQCDQCGKAGYRSQSWAYKRKIKNKTMFFCSWSCLSKFEKEFPDNKAYLRKIKETV